MVGIDGTPTCIHLHVLLLLYYCAINAKHDDNFFVCSRQRPSEFPADTQSERVVSAYLTSPSGDVQRCSTMVWC